MKLSDLGDYSVVSTPDTSTTSNNNPHNIKLGAATQKYIDNGSASVSGEAKDGGYFLKFKDQEAGKQASKDLLFNSGVYKGLTVDKALGKWSNNGYTGSKLVPDLANKPINTLNPAEQEKVLLAMQKAEGTVPVTGNKPMTLDDLGDYTVDTTKQAPQETPSVSSMALQGIGQAAKQNLVDPFTSRLMDINFEGQNPVSNAIQTGGAIAGGIGDVVSSGLGAFVPESVKKATEGATGAVGGAVSAVIPQAVIDKFLQLKKDHPELAANIDAALNVASVAPGEGIARKVIQKGVEGVETAAKATKAVAKEIPKIAEKKTATKLTELATPRLTAKTATEATKTSPKGILGKISVVPAKRTLEIKDALKSVPDITKGSSLTEKANRVEKAINKEAESLKYKIAKKDIPYSTKDLNTRLKAVEIPEFIKSSDTATQVKANRIIDKFNEIARNKDTKISNLLDARKEFDAWVKKEYPRVFDESSNAVQTLVKNIRTEVNNFIDDSIPDASVKESLKKQNLLYDAHDIINEKAVMGAPKTYGEVGTTRLGRFAERHPTLTKASKNAVKYGTGAALLGAGYKSTGH